jgi:hypothetical protein
MGFDHQSPRNVGVTISHDTSSHDKRMAQKSKSQPL